MKIYKFEVEVREGLDEFWKGIEDKVGIDELMEVIKEGLDSTGLDFKLTPTSFKYIENNDSL